MLNYANLSTLFSSDNILNILLFLGLTFLGVTARVSIDIELYKRKIKLLNFLNRWFFATVLSYILELYIAEKEFLRKYYSELIIIFCIFVTDIIQFLLKYKTTIFIYLFNALTKGIVDLRDTIVKKRSTNNDTN